MSTRKKKTPRAFQPIYPTGHAEDVATASDEFVADIHPSNADGRWHPDAHWVIRQGHDGPIIDHAYGAMESEVREHVALLNRTHGELTHADKTSWGILKKQGARSDRVVTTLVEQLIALPRIRAELERYIASGTALSLHNLEGLLGQIAPTDGVDISDTDLLEAVSQKLWRKMGIHRAEEGRRART